ncbi:hypothetical protein J5N97_004641 [Dioscorea zingiberensis]|uniref:Bulb-type lectin domain-containing protein n=1 Tax=Dioscorea zingiberensis TaxID=325984 RepID=A0A9D5D6J1_9LILI|nr:hypothetical protein J5N97_004641 [Dioscorea zingiberensis]
MWFLFMASVYGILATSSVWVHLLCGGMMGFLWIQSGWIGHDSGHYQVMSTPGYNRLIQILSGNCLAGISIAWWKRNHNAHPSIACNSLEFDPDLQHMPIFAVSSKLFTSLTSYFYERKMNFDAVARLLVSYQHWTFYPGMIGSEKQTMGTLDISCSPWMDWFHGGLQFQVEHHLFPRLPRRQLRDGLSTCERALQEAQIVKYLSVSFWEANLLTLRTLEDCCIASRELVGPVSKEPWSGRLLTLTDEVSKVFSSADTFEFELASCSTGEIPISSELSASQNQVWLSENSTFAFGFTSSGSDDQFLLAIWYFKLPGDPTVIWSPNRESPVGRDAVVKLHLTGNLVLFDGNSSLWMSNTSSQGVKSAVMSESGSFILYNGSSSDRQIAWQSFWHPSDTLLPGQQLTVSLELSSLKSSLGYYSLKMLQQRTSLSLALAYVSPESYASSPEFHANYSYWSSPEISNATGDVVAVLDQSGNFGIMFGSSSSGTMYVHKNDTGGGASTLRRITIGTDGNLRLYRWDETWVTEWSALSNPCMAAGVCGNGVCTLDGSKTNSSCTCLQGTTSVSSGDKECFSTTSPVKCGENRSIGVRMETVAQTNYYFSGASTIKNHSNVAEASQCSDYCLTDCECVAAVYRLEGGQNILLLDLEESGVWRDIKIPAQPSL